MVKMTTVMTTMEAFQITNSNSDSDDDINDQHYWNATNDETKSHRRQLRCCSDN
jgi:hypothetical protein